jgi:uncharacterized protein (DUF2141 family)
MLLLTLTLLSQAPSSKVVVTIDNPRSAQGTMNCSIFDTALGFPGRNTVDAHNVRGTFANGKATCEFSVPPGTWAVSVLHDENGNDQLDTGLFGIPKEGYGASNNVLPTFSAPKFQDARFEVKANEPKALSVRLKY